jgi:uncharacterized protein
MEFQKLILKAKKDPKIIAIALFGSTLKTKGRDIDLCLFLDKKYSNLTLSRIRLKYLKEFNYDIQIFQALPLYIKSRILKQGKILYSKNTPELYEIYFQTIKEFGFYKKMYEIYLQNVS